MQISFTIDAALVARVQANLDETWDGVDDQQPSFSEVFNEALSNVARDIYDELDDQARCQKVDTCQAQAMIKRALADELRGAT